MWEGAQVNRSTFLISWATSSRSSFVDNEVLIFVTWWVRGTIWISFKSYAGVGLSTFTPSLRSQHSNSVFGTSEWGIAIRASSYLDVSKLLWQHSRATCWSPRIVPTCLSRSEYFKVRYRMDTPALMTLIVGLTNWIPNILQIFFMVASFDGLDYHALT